MTVGAKVPILPDQLGFGAVTKYIYLVENLLFATRLLNVPK
jgi:hypothetical protein